MKKRNFKNKLNISKNTVSKFDVDRAKGGTGTGTAICGPSNNAMCTFIDACFSKGDGCSRWQVC